MTSTTFHRLVQALVPAAIVAALAVPTVALAGANAGYGPHDGWYTYAVSLTSSAKSLTVDGRSPDTQDAAYNAQQRLLVPVDGRSPDTQDAAYNAQQRLLVPVDGRSPDTIDAALSPQPIMSTPASRFDWGDASIGAGLASGLLTLVAATALLWLRRHSSDRFQTT